MIIRMIMMRLRGHREEKMGRGHFKLGLLCKNKEERI